MKRFPTSRALVAILLLGILVVLIPTNAAFAESKVHFSANRTKDLGPGTTKEILNCLGNLSIDVIGTLLTRGALGFEALSSATPICVSAVVDIFSPSAPAPSQPKVDILRSPSYGSLNGAVRSNAVANCTNFPQNLQFNFFVPFEMVVGQQGRQSNFNASPNGSSDNELIAEQLFGNSTDVANAIRPSGPGQIAVYTIPPHTQIVITLPITLFYETGEAQVTHADSTTADAPWFFTTSYVQSGPITYTPGYC